MRIKRLTISGYRCFAEPFVLDDLGQVVALYGENNSGKSTVLSALRLLGRLMAIPLMQLVLAEAQRAESAYERLGEDTWMFTLGQPRRVTLEVEWTNPSRTLLFEVKEEGDANIIIALIGWQDDNVDQLSLLRRLGTPMVYPDDELVVEIVDGEEAERQREREELERKWMGMTPAHSEHVATVGPNYVPASRTTLQTIADALRSTDIVRRNRAKALLKELNVVARWHEEEGELELGGTDGAPDLSFVEDRGVLPLRQLGSGTQAIVTLLAALHLTRCAVLCLEEPETHQNPNQQNEIVRVLEGRAGGEQGPQIFLATHSLTLAGAQLDLRLMEREGGHRSVHRSSNAEVLAKFGAHLNAEAPPRAATRFVGEDGAVLLPQSLRDELGIRPRELVFFVRRETTPGSPTWEIVSERAIDEALEDGGSE